jgi:hypothetical protein
MWRNMLITDPTKNSQFLGDGKSGGVVKMVSNTRATVFEPLRDFSLTSLVHSCLCQASTEPS